MLKEETILFTIGQFAALHEINKKTLMWYDEIGLLKPVCIKENGYRYYSYQQSSTLETILTLRELNVSLNEIKHFMEHRTIDSFDHLLKEKTAQLSQTVYPHKQGFLYICQRFYPSCLCRKHEDMFRRAAHEVPF